jgi:hypothetical protein
MPYLTEWTCGICKWSHVATHNTCDWCDRLKRSGRGQQHVRDQQRAYAKGERGKERPPDRARSNSRARGGGGSRTSGGGSHPQQAPSQGDGRGGFRQPRSQESSSNQVRWGRTKDDPLAKAVQKARDKAAQKAGVEANARDRLAASEAALIAFEVRIAAEKRDLEQRALAAAAAEADAVKLELELEERDNLAWGEAQAGSWEEGWCGDESGDAHPPAQAEMVQHLLSSANPAVQWLLKKVSANANSRKWLSAADSGGASQTQEDTMEDILEMAVDGNETAKDVLMAGIERLAAEHAGDEACNLKRELSELVDQFQIYAPKAAKAARRDA